MYRPDSHSIPAHYAPCWGARLLAFWPAKLIGLTLGMTGFFVIYFWILRHPVDTPRVMPLTVVDRWIGFSPLALPFYLSLWIYVSLAPSLLDDRRELITYGGSALFLALSGLVIFYYWPSTVPAMDVDWSRYPAFAFLKTVDASGNACPSLHAAFAVFTAVWLHRTAREMRLGGQVRGFNLLWALAILYSTLATRQHVAIDALAGAVLGGVVAWLGVKASGVSHENTSASAGGTTHR